jgi:branched-chain amino acid transport system substrate-binding protein
VKTFFVLLLALSVGAAGASDAPLALGVGLPRSGMLADFGAEYEQGLELWRDDVNRAGGLAGRPVELRILDDGSDASNAGPIYERLIGEHNAEVLIGPYGSAATLVAAAVAERARRVLLNAAAPSRAVHRHAPRFVFQVTSPYVAYGEGAIELAKQGNYRSVFILSRDDPVSREMAEAARETALKHDLQAAEITFYRPGSELFDAEVEKARALPDAAWIAFADVREAAGLVRTLRRLDHAPALFFARGASEHKFIALVGQDAEFSLGLAEYQPAWRTRRNEEFVQRFRARWSRNPGVAAARGYAAGMVLEEALRQAGGTDQDKLRAVLSELSTETVLGRYQVDPANGEQLGMKPAVVQILKGRREVVWPSFLKTAEAVLNYPRWSERQVLK